MTSFTRSVAFFLTLLSPILLSLPSRAMAYELDLELEPGEPATPITLPPGTTIDDINVTLNDVDLVSDPTPQPALRTLYVGGYPITVPSQPSPDPLRVSVAQVNGRAVLLVSARPLIDAGRVRSVRATVRLTSSWAGFLPPVPPGWRASIPTPEPILVIVTTDRIVERSASLSRYIQWRRAGGFTVIVGTDRDWDFPVTEGPDHRAERIREWLRGVRDEVGLGYVLLIGSPQPRSGSIPMVMTHAMTRLAPYYSPELAEVLNPAPTDHFFADLEGDWDLDDDGRYGEYPEDDGPTGVRWDPDAIVGRLPVYGDDTESLDRMLESVIEYESTESPGYRHRVLLPAARPTSSQRLSWATLTRSPIPLSTSYSRGSAPGRPWPTSAMVCPPMDGVRSLEFPSTAMAGSASSSSTSMVTRR